MNAPGICRVCGCTDDNACEGGCVWANSGATLCSQCIDADGLVERSELPGELIDEPAIGDDFVAELDELDMYTGRW
jgi:hypothetical protein